MLVHLLQEVTSIKDELRLQDGLIRQLQAAQAAHEPPRPSNQMNTPSPARSGGVARPLTGDYARSETILDDLLFEHDLNITDQHLSKGKTENQSAIHTASDLQQDTFKKYPQLADITGVAHVLSHFQPLNSHCYKSINRRLKIAPCDWRLVA